MVFAVVQVCELVLPRLLYLDFTGFSFRGCSLCVATEASRPKISLTVAHDVARSDNEQRQESNIWNFIIKNRFLIGC